MGDAEIVEWKNQLKKHDESSWGEWEEREDESKLRQTFLWSGLWELVLFSAVEGLSLVLAVSSATLLPMSAQLLFTQIVYSVPSSNFCSFLTLAWVCGWSWFSGAGPQVCKFLHLWS